MSMDSLRDTFFAECEELLDALSEGLTAIAAGTSDNNTVNAIFRAVHSIKGAAGAFALTDLVSFAHKLETVLDLIRSGSLDIDAEVLRVITRSGDVLAQLVELAQNDSTERPETMDSLLSALSDLAGPQQEASASEFVFEALSFSPMVIVQQGPRNRFRIGFRPYRSLFENGHDPIRLFRALSDKGTVTAQCNISGVPSLDRFDPEESYLTWTLELAGDVADSEIKTIFSFVDGLCDLTIDRIEANETPPALMPVPEAPPHEPPRALAPEPAAAIEPAQPKPAAPVSPADVAESSAESGDSGRGKGGQGGAASAQASPRQTLRVDPERVDRLINTVGELIINQAVIAQKVIASGIAPNSEIMADLDDYRYLAREIQEGVMAIRAQPVKSLFQRMGRVVREAGEATGKQVTLVTEGEATEVDKTVVERLADPLTHMLRNAVDHGIELPEKREANGKPVMGTVRLSAAHRSGHVLIEIADDSAGLNRDRILETAIRRGLVPPESKLSDAEIDNLLFLPGFSTASTVTNLSGRGVGMDVVKTTITSLGGRVTISSQPGKGSVFSISLPLTLAVLDGMVVTVGKETMVLPLPSIVETIRPRQQDIRPVGKMGHVLSIRGAYVPVISLAGILGMQQNGNPNGNTFVLIRSEGSATIALSVEGISDQRQVVIKSLEGNYGSIPGISAATILGDGKIALIVDTEAVISLAAQMPASQFLQDMEMNDERFAALG